MSLINSTYFCSLTKPLYCPFFLFIFLSGCKTFCFTSSHKLKHVMHTQQLVEIRFYRYSYFRKQVKLNFVKASTICRLVSSQANVFVYVTLFIITNPNQQLSPCSCPVLLHSTPKCAKVWKAGLCSCLLTKPAVKK